MSVAYDKAHEIKDIDLAQAARKVWLIKVPKYLADRWMTSADKSEVGKLKVVKGSGAIDVSFQLNKQLCEPVKEGDFPCPTDHKLIMHKVDLSSDSLFVYSQDQIVDMRVQDQDPYNFTMSVAGRVSQRVDCRPDPSDPRYMKMKQAQLKQHNQPKREVPITNVKQLYKPVASHEHHVSIRTGTKKDEKRTRDSKDKVMDMLFRAFENHQYYNLKDLVSLTKQPVAYLKDILKEIAVYNMKPPHKNMWELKTEYRHYKSNTGNV